MIFMISSMRLRLILLVFTGVSSISPTFGQDYDVQLTPPSKAGEKFHLSAVAYQTTTNAITANTEIVGTTSSQLAAEFEAIATILEVSTKGKPISTSYEIIQCSLVHGESEETNLAAGTIVLDARKSATDPILVNGRPASAASAEVFNLFLVYTDARAARDGDIFGPSNRVKVGDTWPINREAFLDDYEKSFPGKSLGTVSGTSQLVGREKFDGKDALLVACKLSMTDYFVPLPPQAELVDSRATIRSQYKSPVQPSSAIGENKIELRLLASARAQDEEGNSIMMNIDVERMALITVTQYPEK